MMSQRRTGQKRGRELSSDGVVEPRGVPSKVFSFGDLVAVLQKIEASTPSAWGRLEVLTNSAVLHVLKLLDQQRAVGERKRGREERIALRKKHALVLLALLVDGDNHIADMKRLTTAIHTAPCEKSFDKLLESLCLTGEVASLLLKQTVDDHFRIAELATRIPSACEDLAGVLTQRSLLKEGHCFGSCKVWCPRDREDHGFDRHIAIVPLLDQTVKQIRTITGSARVALVCGESGSGKTFSSILSAGGGICIYLTANDFFSLEVKKGAIASRLKSEAGTKREAAPTVLARQEQMCEELLPTTCLCMLLRKLITNVAAFVGAKFSGRVMLVVDEVGGHPLLVRGLCREAKGMVQTLKAMLQLTGPVGVVASGTGSETADSHLGSHPDTHTVIQCERDAFSKHVIRLIEAQGLCSLAGLLSNKPIAASYYPPQLVEVCASLGYVQRLLTNRRFAAALFVELEATLLKNCQVPEHAPRATPQVDATVPWLTVLPWLTSAALLKFKALNSMSTKSFVALCVLFADALAICFGGHEQRPCTMSRMLNRRLGMIVDNARTDDPAHCGLILARSGDGSLVLPQYESGTAGAHFGRRFGMGPATLEMGLQGFSLSTAARTRSGDGFEHTMVDFFHCWALACCSSVIITLPGEATPNSGIPASAGAVVGKAPPLPHDNVDGNDAVARQALFAIMATIRDCVRRVKASIVIRVRLTKRTTTVEEAVQQTFKIAHKMTHREGVPFVIVAHTAPLAPFADVVVVAGVTSSAAGPHAPTMFVAVQLKHFTAKPLSPLMALGEHLKQGSPIFATKKGAEAAEMIRTQKYEKARTSLAAAYATYEPQYPLVSLVLVVCRNEFTYTKKHCAVDQIAGLTTVRIRSEALRGVIHPVPPGSDPQRPVVSYSDDFVISFFPSKTE